jgi:hypothetical protein
MHYLTQTAVPVVVFEKKNSCEMQI